MNIFGTIVDPLVVAEIMALVTGGVASLVTQLIKTWLKLSGTAARILTGAVAVGCTAAYFGLIAPPFVLGTFLIYAVVVFGEATAFFHIFGPGK
jgi:hypothetical protein